MGLSEPALVTPREKILDPRTGKPIASDPFFLQAKSELSDKGFLVAAADDLIAWARTGSLMWKTIRSSERLKANSTIRGFWSLHLRISSIGRAPAR